MTYPAQSDEAWMLGVRIVNGEPLYSAAWLDGFYAGMTALENSLREPRGGALGESSPASAPAGGPRFPDGEAQRGKRSGASLSVIDPTKTEAQLVRVERKPR